MAPEKTVSESLPGETEALDSNRKKIFEIGHHGGNIRLRTADREAAVQVARILYHVSDGESRQKLPGGKLGAPRRVYLTITESDEGIKVEPGKIGRPQSGTLGLDQLRSMASAVPGLAEQIEPAIRRERKRIATAGQFRKSG